MKNVTLSIPDEILRKSREYAQKHGTSLNQMIRDYLSRIIGEEKISFEEKIRKSREELGTVDTTLLKNMSRDELHER